MIKLLVTDFNYLLDIEEAIAVSTMLEIERIRKKGISFAVITDKLYKEILDYNKDFPFLDYILSLNCSCVYDVNNDKYLYKKKLNNSALNKLINLFSNYKMIFYTEDKAYKKIDDIKDKDILQIEVVLNNKDLDILEDLNKINVNVKKISNNKKIHLYITAPKASKFLGIDNISLKNNIALRDVVLITDNESDDKLFTNIDIYKDNINDILKKI